MKSSKQLMIVAVAIAALTACGGGSDDATSGGGDPADVPLSQAPASVQEYAALFNEARATARNCGAEAMPAVPPLTKFNPKLQASAQAHADDMTAKNYFAHERRDGKTLLDFGYTGINTSENLMLGSPSTTPNKHTSVWLQSPGHCKGIMNADSRTVAVARSGRYTVMVYAY